YQLSPDTVVRGGAGIFYGMSVATNWQFPSPAFEKSANIYFSKDNFQTQYASLSDPFPAGLAPPQGTKYGPLAQWALPMPATWIRGPCAMPISTSGTWEF